MGETFELPIPHQSLLHIAMAHFPLRRSSTLSLSASQSPPLGLLAFILSSMLRFLPLIAKLQYLVSWIGYPSVDNMWLPALSLTNSPDLVASFHRSHPLAASPTHHPAPSARRR